MSDLYNVPGQKNRFNELLDRKGAIVDEFGPEWDSRTQAIMNQVSIHGQELDINEQAETVKDLLRQEIVHDLQNKSTGDDEISRIIEKNADNYDATIQEVIKHRSGGAKPLSMYDELTTEDATVNDRLHMGVQRKPARWIEALRYGKDTGKGLAQAVGALGVQAASDYGYVPFYNDEVGEFASKTADNWLGYAAKNFEGAAEIDVFDADNYRSIYDVPSIVVNEALKQLPTTIATLWVGGVGGMGAKTFGGKFLKDKVSKMIIDKAMKGGMTKIAAEQALRKSLTGRLGKMAYKNMGMAGAGAAVESGSIFSEIHSELGKKDVLQSIKYGIPAGLLESIMPSRLLGRIKGSNFFSEASQHLAKKSNMFADVAKDMGTEEFTEFVQTYIENAAVQRAKGIDWSDIIMSEKNLLEASRAGLSALAGTGPTSAVTTIGSRIAPKLTAKGIRSEALDQAFEKHREKAVNTLKSEEKDGATPEEAVKSLSRIELRAMIHNSDKETHPEYYAILENEEASRILNQKDIENDYTALEHMGIEQPETLMMEPSSSSIKDLQIAIEWHEEGVVKFEEDHVNEMNQALEDKGVKKPEAKDENQPIKGEKPIEKKESKFVGDISKYDSTELSQILADNKEGLISLSPGQVKMARKKIKDEPVKMKKKKAKKEVKEEIDVNQVSERIQREIGDVDLEKTFEKETDAKDFIDNFENYKNFVNESRKTFADYKKLEKQARKLGWKPKKTELDAGEFLIEEARGFLKEDSSKFPVGKGMQIKRNIADDVKNIEVKDLESDAILAREDGSDLSKQEMSEHAPLIEIAKRKPSDRYKLALDEMMKLKSMNKNGLLSKAKSLGMTIPKDTPRSNIENSLLRRFEKNLILEETNALKDLEKKGIKYSKPIREKKEEGHLSADEINDELVKYMKKTKGTKGILKIKIEPKAPEKAPTAQGSFIDGTVTLFMENIKEVGDIEKVMRHEAFVHGFLKSILGKEKFGNLLDAVVQEYPDFKKRVEKVYSKHKAYRLPNGKLNPDLIAEEVLAHIAQDHENNGFHGEKYPSVQRLVNYIKKKFNEWMKKYGFKKRFNTMEVEKILQDAYYKFQRKEFKPSGDVKVEKLSDTLHSKLESGISEPKELSPENIALYNAKVEVMDILIEGGAFNADSSYELKSIDSKEGGYIDEYLEAAGENRTFEEIYEDKLTDEQDYLDDVDDISEYTISEIAKMAKGVTDDIGLAGYVLDDGTLLDFSGGQGARYEDHRQLNLPINMEISGTDLMNKFMRESGAVRIDANSGMVDLETKPTSKQLSTISDILMENGGYVDLTDGKRNASFEVNVGGEKKALGKIRSFYKGNDVSSDVLFSLDMRTAKVDTNSENFKKWFGESKVVDEKGNPKVSYHGAQRPDRIGGRFMKSRATSGPMQFFTSDPKVASNYSTGKTDNSLEFDSLIELFTVKVRGQKKSIPVNQLWNKLTGKEKLDAIRNLKKMTDDEDTGKIKLSNDPSFGEDTVDHHIKRDGKGNAIDGAYELWVKSGQLYDEEHRFLDVLNLMGIDNVKFDNPRASYPGVVPVYLSIKNPLDTSSISSDIFDKIIARSKRQKAPEYTQGVDQWEKHIQDPNKWTDRFKEDQKNDTAYAWTSIPDWVTRLLKEEGYDGVKDRGGKYSPYSHDVWVPFEENQVKSSISNTGEFSETKRGIMFSEPVDPSVPKDIFEEFKTDKKERQPIYNFYKKAFPGNKDEVSLIERYFKLPEYMRNKPFFSEYLEVAYTRMQNRVELMTELQGYAEGYRGLDKKQRVDVDELLIKADRHNFDPSDKKSKAESKVEKNIQKEYDALSPAQQLGYDSYSLAVSKVKDKIIQKLKDDMIFIDKKVTRLEKITDRFHGLRGIKRVETLRKRLEKLANDIVSASTAMNIKPAEAQKLADDIMKATKSMGKNLDLDKFEQRLKTLFSGAAETAILTKSIDDLKFQRSEIQGEIDGLKKMNAYIPRIREDGYHVTYTDENGEKHKNVFPGVSEWSKTEANNFAKRLAKKGIDAKVEEAKRRDENAFEDVTLSKMTGFMREAVKYGDIQPGKNSDVDRAVDDALKTMFAVRGFGKHMLKRSKDYYKGFKKENLGEVLNSYLSGYAGNVTKGIASQQYAEILSKIDAQKLPGLFGYLHDTIKDELENKGTIDRYVANVQGAMFYHYMGWRASSAANNLTQNFLNGIPNMLNDLKESGEMKFYSYPVEWIKLMKAMNDVVADGKISKVTGKIKGVGLKPDEKKIIDEWKDKIQKESLVYENAGDFAASNNPIWKAITKTGTYMFQKAEELNRLSAMLWHYRKFGDEKKAMAFIRRTHFNYGNENKPIIFRGNTKVLKPFLGGLATYNWNLGNWLFQNAKNPLVLNSWLFGMMMFRGVPLEDSLEYWANRNGVSFRKFMESTIGEFGANIAQRGLLPSIMQETLGTAPDLSGSLKENMPEAINVASKFILGGADDGPSQQIGEKMAKVFTGEGSVGELFPIAFQKGWNAIEESREGYKTRSGRPILTPEGERYKIGLMETLLKMASFNTVSRANFKERQWTGRRIDSNLGKEKSSIRDRLMDGKDVDAEIDAFNSLIYDIMDEYGTDFIKTRPITKSYIKSGFKGMKGR